MEQNCEGARKLRTCINRVWTKVHETLKQCGRPDRILLVYITFPLEAIYSPFSLKVIEKPNKCRLNVLWAHNFFWRDDHRLSHIRQIVIAIYCAQFGKKLFEFRLLMSMHAGNEVECGIYVGWIKMQVQFEAVYGPKFMSFRDDVGHPSSPSWMSTQLPIVYIMFR